MKFGKISEEPNVDSVVCEYHIISVHIVGSGNQISILISFISRVPSNGIVSPIHSFLLGYRLEMNRSTASVLPQTAEEPAIGELNNEFIDKYLHKDDEGSKGTGEEKGGVDKGRNSSVKPATVTALLLKQNLINRIGDVSDYSQLRKLSISFNNIGKCGLRNLDQLPHLRHLSAYCCGLKGFEDLADNRRLEKLHLQQNCIVEIPYCMRQMQKIRHLRIDRNQIQQIENLQGCTGLRSLDLSSNRLESIEGVAGLQSLTELKVNNNKITSLKALRALPSLKEVQVDNNALKNLDGIQHIPTLQVLYCNNNQITAFKIPQTYTHIGAVEKGVMEKSTTSSTASKNSNTSSTAKVSHNSNNRNNSKNSGSNARSESTKLGLFHLSDIFMAGNQLTSLDGADKLGESLFMHVHALLCLSSLNCLGSMDYTIVI